MSNSVRPHRRQPTRLPRPWDSPDKNTGVGCQQERLLLYKSNLKGSKSVSAIYNADNIFSSRNVTISVNKYSLLVKKSCSVIIKKTNSQLPLNRHYCENPRTQQWDQNTLWTTETKNDDLRRITGAIKLWLDGSSPRLAQHTSRELPSAYGFSRAKREPSAPRLWKASQEAHSGITGGILRVWPWEYIMYQIIRLYLMVFVIYVLIKLGGKGHNTEKDKYYMV